MNTNSPSPKIIELRELLARKHPSPAPQPEIFWSTGLLRLDEATGGGLWKGGMVEVVEEHPSAGGAAFLRSLLWQAARQGCWSGLVDGRDSFDPQGVSGMALPRLLWLRCHTAAEAMQCTDLLLRDGNLPLVCLDLQFNTAAELRQISSPSWYRLQRMVEPTGTAFLALTPFALLPCADVRLKLGARFSLEALEDEPATLWEWLRLEVLRRRQSAQLSVEAPAWHASA